jgi:hypothetical protein
MIAGISLTPAPPATRAPTIDPTAVPAMRSNV